MGSLFSSDSESSSSTSTTQQQVAGQGGAGTTVVTGAYGTTNLTISDLGAQAVANQLSRDALAVGAVTSRDALATSAQVSRDAMTISALTAAGVQAGANEISRDAFALAAQSSNAAFETAKSLTDSATAAQGVVRDLASGSNATAIRMAEIGSNTAQALSSQNQETFRQMVNANLSAVAQSQNLARDTIALQAGNEARALQTTQVLAERFATSNERALATAYDTVLNAAPVSEGNIVRQSNQSRTIESAILISGLLIAIFILKK